VSMVILEIPIIKGECKVVTKEKDYTGMILCESLSQDMNVEMEVSTNARRTVHVPKVENIALERKWDKASPKLISKLLRGSPGDVWKIHCLKPIGDGGDTNSGYQWGEFLTIELADPMIAKHSLSVNEGDTTESLEINATNITWIYTVYDEKMTAAKGGGVEFNLLTGKVGGK
jgi:type VI protein secretion system component Hcp